MMMVKATMMMTMTAVAAIAKVVNIAAAAALRL